MGKMWAGWLLVSSGILLGGACSGDDETLFSASNSTSTGTTTSASSGSGTACVPGQQIACPCGVGSQGAQVCEDDGSKYGPCDCGGQGGAGNAGAGGNGGMSGDGGRGGATLCRPGEAQACYSGPAGTQGVGLCVPGTATCEADGQSFRPCVGEVTPAIETCATPGDDDCDGVANEDGIGCGCVPGSQQACYSGPPATENVGACHGGMQLCQADGMGFGPCVGEATPAAETCMTPVDDDCDGATNEEGPGCVCVPGSMGSCYEGPMGTENVGTCKPGTHVCDAQGTAWGPCAGQVLPGQDLCATVADEDCNGSPIPCSQVPTWSKDFGGMGSTGIGPLALDGAGNVFFGMNAGGVDLGQGPVAGPTIVKLDSSGNVLWYQSYGTVEILAAATDPAGNLIFGGILYGTVDFGGGPVTSPGGNQQAAFAVKLDSLGQHLWSKQFSVNGSSETRSLGTDSNGNVLIGGRFVQIDFGGGVLTAPTNNNGDLYIAKLTPAGAHVWSKQGGNANGGRVHSIAADGLGNVLASGWFSQSIDLGSGPVPAAGGGIDFFVAKLAPNGAPAFVKAFGDNVIQFECYSALDAAGNVLLAGPVQGVVDFGGGPLLPVVNNANDVFVAKLDSTGAHAWSKRFGNGSPNLAAGDVAADAAGNVHVIGGFGGTLDFGGGSLTSAGQTDVFLLEYGPSGLAISTQKFGDGADQFGFQIEVDPLGAPIISGGFSGSIDFGNGALLAGPAEVFVAKLAP